MKRARVFRIKSGQVDGPWSWMNGWYVHVFIGGRIREYTPPFPTYAEALAYALDAVGLTIPEQHREAP